MGEETKDAQQVLKSDDTGNVGTTTYSASAGGSSDSKQDRQKSDRDGRNDTPIEELYDLTKPLKRVERPSKEAHEADLKVIEDEIEQLIESRKAVQKKIDGLADKHGNSAAQKERDGLASLRAKKAVLIGEKRDIRSKLNSLRDKTDKLFEDRKSAKQGVRFSSVKDIDDEIRTLKKRQETTSMSLADEKRLIREMDQLQASKKLVAQIKGKEEERKQISAQLAAKDKEIDAVQAELDEKTKRIESFQEKEPGFREESRGLIAEREKVRDEVNKKIQEKNTLKNNFRAKNNEWYSYQRALRAQKKMHYEEERKRREEEKAAYLKKLEEEELKKEPYEEEQALCEYLSKYLTVTYLDPMKKASGEQIQGGSGSSMKNDSVFPVSDDPFANVKPMNKKDDDDVYLRMGKGKKLRERKSKKEKKIHKKTPFRLNMDTFDQFGLIGLVPPTTLEDVEKSVEELRVKKEWYSKQPRGSVLTATQIRKENEKNAAKLKSSGEIQGRMPSPTNGKRKDGPSGFSLSTEDFVPLGGTGGGSGTTAVFNSSWGQNVSAPRPTRGGAKAAVGGEGGADEEEE